MTELTSITGKALLDRKIMIRVLALLEPTQLTRDATLFDVGYERAKADLLQILGESLGPEFAKSHAVRIIQQLRRGEE